MKNFLHIINTTIIVVLFATGCKTNDNEVYLRPLVNPGIVEKPAIPFSPHHYNCQWGDSITIDGIITEPDWIAAPWSNDFLDIMGTLRPVPKFPTRFKMLRDNQYLYLAMEITATDIQDILSSTDTLNKANDAVSLFIDPNGDTHDYYEFEISPAGITNDYIYTMPPRDKGKKLQSWSPEGKLMAVKVYGTINNSSDSDYRWNIELALPIDALAGADCHVTDSATWRINILRRAGYTQKLNSIADPNNRPDNWVWSPQGVDDIHYPEMWGYLHFTSPVSGRPAGSPAHEADSDVYWKLRTLYYAQRVYATKNGAYSADVQELRSVGYEPYSTDPAIVITANGYEASMKSIISGRLWIISENGRIHLPDQEKEQ